jgi:Mor family transcriptional regulator
MHRELFRWFEIPEPENMMRPKTRSNLVPAIGVCAAVPMHEIMHWIKIYQDHGAAFTWWNTPVDRAIRTANPSAGKRPRRQLDHAVVYRMLDAGKTCAEIAKHLDFPKENIHYVFKKWSAGLPVYGKFNKPRIDAAAMISEYRAGVTPTELADRYTTSVSYVYKILKIKNLEWLDQNQP